MKRIGLYLGIPPEGGGAFQYSLSMLEAVNALPRDRFQPVVVFCRSEWKALVDRCELDTVFVPTPWWSELFAYSWRKLGLPLNAWRCAAPYVDPPSRALIALKCDLWIYPAQDPMAYMLPAPALATVHDLMHRYEAHFPEVSGRRLRERHYRAICRYAKGVLVDSEVGRQQLAASYGIDAQRVYPFPYVSPKYMHATEDPSGFEERYRLPEKFLFYPAQFWEHKNHQALIRVAYRLLPTLPDLNLVFVGAKKNGYGKLIDLVNRLGLSGHVHVLGYVPNEDMPALYRRARALVMPTFFGPTNIPPLEAMVVGCPIAISRKYGMPEQCGDAALYFDPSSDEEIADVISRLWTDGAKCAELAARGRVRAFHFSQQTFNERLVAVLDRVLAGQTEIGAIASAKRSLAA